MNCIAHHIIKWCSRGKEWDGRGMWHGRREMHTGFWWRNMRDRDHWGDLRWEDNFKLDLQEVGWGIDWIHLAQNRDRWRGLVNAVMNYQVPKNWIIFWVAEVLLVSLFHGGNLKISLRTPFLKTFISETADFIYRPNYMTRELLPELRYV